MNSIILGAAFYTFSISGMVASLKERNGEIEERGRNKREKDSERESQEKRQTFFMMDSELNSTLFQVLT